MQSILDKVDQELAGCQSKWDMAKHDTPECYHHFLMGIENKKKIATMRSCSDDEEKALKEHDAWRNKDNGDVYVEVRNPYMTVDGRVKWFMSDIRQWIKDTKYNSIVPPFRVEEIMDHDKKLFSVRYITPFGEAIGTAKIGIGGKAVDSTNPYENSETSAYGRALGMLGYGIVGTGIASAEDVGSAKDERERLERQIAQQKPNGTPPVQGKGTTPPAGEPPVQVGQPNKHTESDKELSDKADRARKAVFAQVGKWVTDNGLDKKIADNCMSEILCKLYNVDSRTKVPMAKWLEINTEFYIASLLKKMGEALLPVQHI